jgi:uncharacterized membrane protein YraQ (UPF0718 family)
VVPAYIASWFVPHDGSLLSEFTHAVREFINLMWWGLALGIVAVGLLQFVPQNRIRNWLGERSNLSGLTRAVSAGLLFDVCSHGILLVGMQLYRRGLSLGQTMAFLIASPWNSISLTFILIGLIGWKWTLLFIGLSVIIAFLSGLLFDLLERRSVVPANPYRRDFDSQSEPEPGFMEQLRPLLSTPAGWWRWIGSAVNESKMVIRWILFGTVLAAVLRVVVHPDIFADWFGPSLIGLGLTLVAATIIEVCSEGSSPIAADLLNRANAPGNGFTFLMAGVATDYTEVLAIRETMRSWKIALLLPAITVPQIVLIGWILNSLS